MSARVKYTHGHSAGALTSHRWRTAANSAAFLLPHLTPTSSVLDVGCGPGTMTVDFAKLCPEGRVVGVDAAQVIVDAATKEHGATAPNLSFAVGDALRLPFDDGAFDVVHCHQLLMHVGDAVGALREMRRVCAAGGRVACREGDLGGTAWAPADARLAAWRDEMVAVTRANGGDPLVGRNLLRYALEAGFEVDRVRPSSSVWCFARPAERAWWGGMWAVRAQDGGFMEGMIARGRTRAELEGIAEAWRAWAEIPHAWFSFMHGEIVFEV